MHVSMNQHAMHAQAHHAVSGCQTIPGLLLQQIARRTREAAEAAAAADAAAKAAQATARAAAQQLPKQGPHLEAATERLPFFCLPGCSQSATLPVRNLGTAAVYYSWSSVRMGVGSSAISGSGGSSNSDSSGSSAISGSGRRDEQRFYQPDQKGVILPGDLKEFRCAVLRPVKGGGVGTCGDFVRRSGGVRAQQCSARWCKHSRTPLRRSDSAA